MIARLVINNEDYCINIDPDRSIVEFYQQVFEQISAACNLKSNIRMHVLHNGRIVRPDADIVLRDIVAEEYPTFVVKYYENTARPRKMLLLRDGTMILIE